MIKIIRYYIYGLNWRLIINRNEISKLDNKMKEVEYNDRKWKEKYSVNC